MKVRIGISGGGESAGPEALVGLARAIVDNGFDSLWLPEVLTRPGPDPLVGLAWVTGACPGLKIGTTMLLPGRNLVWLAKAVGTLDQLSGGRFLLTFVPGLGLGGESSAIGIPTSTRAAQMEDALPVLRRLWAGEVVSHEGVAGSFADVSVSPRPVQDPFDVWLGGNVPSALERCGRLADGWIPAFCTPADAAAGKEVIDQVAAEHERAISPEHFGVSLAYAPEGADLAPLAATPLARRARGRPLEEIIPVGLKGLRAMIERFLDVGFSKFIVRPLGPPEDWRAELEVLAGAVGDLQT
jgi:probable F420-dependent oxidoreductase